MGVGKTGVGEMALTQTINISSLEEKKKMLYSDSCCAGYIYTAIVTNDIILLCSVNDL